MKAIRSELSREMQRRKSCRWCGAPGTIVDLIMLAGPTSSYLVSEIQQVRIVCAEPVACVKRQALSQGVDLGLARRAWIVRERHARRLQEARQGAVA